jgi:hypothetical protein
VGSVDGRDKREYEVGSGDNEKKEEGRGREITKVNKKFWEELIA